MEIMGLKKQSAEAQIVVIDGKQFVTNGTWEYGSPGKSKGDGKDTSKRPRTLPVGQIGWRLSGAGKGDPIPLWERAALAAGEKEIIRDIPRITGGGDLINIGDLNGGSAILLAQGLKHHGLSGHVYTIDCYGEETKSQACANRIESETDSLITLLNTTSDEAVKQLDHHLFNFVFIDGDHTYEGVLADWINYSPLITKHGAVAFHDTNQDYTDRVIKEVVTQDWKLEYWVNRIKVFRRREYE